MTTQARIIKCIKNVIGEYPEYLTNDSKVSEINMDSLDYIEIVMEIEREFGVVINDVSIKELNDDLTMGEFFSHYEQLIVDDVQHTVALLQTRDEKSKVVAEIAVNLLQEGIERKSKTLILAAYELVEHDDFEWSDKTEESFATWLKMLSVANEIVYDKSID